MKFKVGDWVRVVKDDFPHLRKVEIGSIYRIKDIFKNVACHYRYGVEDPNGKFYFSEEEIELVDEISTVYEPKIKKEENEMEKILKIYKERKESEIEKEYKNIKDSIKANDEFVILKNNYEKQVQELCKKEFGINLIHSNEELLSEIDALIEMADNYGEKVKILKDYEILKKGKLNF